MAFRPLPRPLPGSRKGSPIMITELLYGNHFTRSRTQRGSRPPSHLTNCSRNSDEAPTVNRRLLRPRPPPARSPRRARGPMAQPRHADSTASTRRTHHAESLPGNAHHLALHRHAVVKGKFRSCTPDRRRYPQPRLRQLHATARAALAWKPPRTRPPTAQRPKHHRPESKAPAPTPPCKFMRPGSAKLSPKVVPDGNKVHRLNARRPRRKSPPS